MSLIDKVIEHTKKAETLLTMQLNASGRGLHEKVTSVEHKLPNALLKRLRYMATIRNKLLHDATFQLSDHEQSEFLKTAEHTVQQLNTFCEFFIDDEIESSAEPSLYTQPPAQPISPYDGPDDTALVFKWILGILVFLLITFWVSIELTLIENKHQQEKRRANTTSPIVKAEPPKNAKTDPKLANKEQTATLQNATTQSAVAHRSEDGSAATTSKTTPKVKDKQPGPLIQPVKGKPKAQPQTSTLSFGHHIFIENDSITLENLQFSYKRGTFDRIQPVITATIKNQTESFLSSVKFDALLFIPNYQDAVVDTTKNQEKLFLFFDEHGLAPSASITRNIYLSSFNERKWTKPDILNASNHQLVLRVKSSKDGMNKSIPLSSPSFDEANITNTIYSAPAQKTSSPTIYDMQTVIHTFANGRSVGIGNSILEITDAHIIFKKDHFNRLKPEITIEVVNRSQHTLSKAFVNADLYINGEKEPALATKKPMILSFGEKGLAPERKIRKVLYFSGFESRNWIMPDILNAKNQQVVLYFDSIRDGLDNKIPNSASKRYKP